MKRFFASIALRLLHLDRLTGRFYFNTIKVQMKTADFVDSFRGFDELRVTL